MRHILIAATFVLAFTACTAATEQLVTSAVEAACVPIVSIETPAAEPICVGADILIQEVESYVASHAGATVPLSSANGVTVVGADLYRQLAPRAPLASKVKRPCKPCPNCPPVGVAPGKVAP